MIMKCSNYEYDVVLSFAGEDRQYVKRTANFLSKTGIKVFYDEYEEIALWGKDLYQHLDEVYQNKAKYAVIFISKAYQNKLWTNHELKSSQARAFSENEEYILPVRFDNTEIPGIRKTIGYLDLRKITPVQLAKKIIKKLGDIEPENFLPENINFIKQAINSIYEDFEADEIESSVFYVFDKLKRTSERERKLLTCVIMHSCWHNLERDIHEDITLFERISGLDKKEIVEILKGLYNIGFQYTFEKTIFGCKKEENEHEVELLRVSFHSRDPDLIMDNLTIFLVLMYLGASIGKCEECCIKTLNRLDFTNLKDDIQEDCLQLVLNSVEEEEEEEELN
jgi:hypothetical protein